MWSWNQFRNLPKNQGLSPAELSRKYFIHESNMMMEAASNAVAAASSAAGSGGGSIKPARSIIWSEVAPAGTGLPDQEYINWEDFDIWQTTYFEPISNVSRLVINNSTAYAHVHADFTGSNLAIDLFNDDIHSWVRVWTYYLENPNFDSDDSNPYVLTDDVTFPTISNVTAIRVWSNPGSDQTYHNWGTTGGDYGSGGEVVFKFYSSEYAAPDYGKLVLLWNPEGVQNSSSPLTASYIDPDFECSGLTLNNMIYSTNSTNVWPVGSPTSSSIDTSAYLNFDIAAPSSTQFKTITYTKRSYVDMTCTSAAIRSSADSYTTNLSEVSVNPLTGTETLVFDVSSLIPTSEISFRIYFWGATGLDWMDLDGTLNGSTGLAVYTN